MPMNGPWIHQNILETIQNIKMKKSTTGGRKVNESDGYCAALPYFLYNNSETDLKRVIKSVANSKINETYALAKLKIISIANDNKKDPVRFFVKKYKNNRYFKDVIKNIKKILRLKKQNHTKVVRKFGKACSYPGTFMGSIHAMISSNNYKSAINKTIKAGGCNCSRANFVGAYFAAYKGLKNIPSPWIKKTIPAKNILKYI
jgi:ADP-ribosylglycohydrolase